MKKKILSILVSLFLFFGITNAKVYAVTEAELNKDQNFAMLISNIENTHEYYFNAKNISGKGEELYRAIVEHFTANVENYDKSIEWISPIDGHLTNEQIKDVVLSFVYDYKMFYWLTGAVNYGYESIPLTTNLKYTISFRVLDIYSNRQVFYQDLDEIVRKQEEVKSIVSQKGSTYLKIKAIHDWILEHNAYRATGEQTNHTPVGILVDRYHPVCEAYAEGFLMLANYNNITAVYGTGRANNGSMIEDHAWNYVFLEGKYYFLDVTWDEPIGSSTYNYKYFLTPIPSSHVPGGMEEFPEILPTPFTNKKYVANNTATFIIDTDGFYVYNGEAMKGYNTISIQENPHATIKIEYYNAEGVKLAGAPKDLGKYYFIATPDDTTGLKGDIRVDFEIVPKLNNVTFKDINNNEVIKVERVRDGDDAPIPLSTKNGIKLVPQSEDYKNVTNDVTVFLKEEPITVQFFDENGNSLPITINNHIYETDYNKDLTGTGKIFIGWTHNDVLVTEESLLVTDLQLRPLIEEIKPHIKNADLRSDGIYRIRVSEYGYEEIVLLSENQFIIGDPLISEVQDKDYTIKITVGSKGSNSVVEYEIQMRQSSMLPFDLEPNQLLLYSGIILAGIIVISIISSIVKKSRKND